MNFSRFLSAYLLNNKYMQSLSKKSLRSRITCQIVSSLSNMFCFGIYHPAIGSRQRDTWIWVNILINLKLGCKFFWKNKILAWTVLKSAKLWLLFLNVKTLSLFPRLWGSTFILHEGRWHHVSTWLKRPSIASKDVISRYFFLI